MGGVLAGGHLGNVDSCRVSEIGGGDVKGRPPLEGEGVPGV